MSEVKLISFESDVIAYRCGSFKMDVLWKLLCGFLGVVVGLDYNNQLINI
jgi:hypothetical protein